MLSGHSKRRTKIGFQDHLSLNDGQKYCRMLQVEHTAILLTFIKLPFVIKIFVLSIFEWLLKTGFNVYSVVLRSRFLGDTGVPLPEFQGDIHKFWGTHPIFSNFYLLN